MIKRLLVALSLVPVLCFGQESPALRNSVDRILDLCGDILADTSSIDSSLYDATAYTMQIRDTCTQINGNLRFFATNFVDFATSELQYSEGTYYLVGNLESYILTIQDEIQNHLTPYVHQMGLDISTLLSHFDSLKNEFHLYSVQVLQRLASIDGNVAEILNAITNRANGVVYDFSFLTNSAKQTQLQIGSRLYSGFATSFRWSSYVDGSLGTTSTSSSQNYWYPTTPSLASYLLTLTGYTTHYVRQLFPQQVKSGVINALAAVSISNDVGRLVLQGNTVTNCLQWSTNYFATILNPLVSEIATNTADIVECQRVITNLLADISSRISSVTNGSDEAEAKVEAEVTKAEEGLEKVDEPPDPEGFEFQMFQVQGHENFISSIPEGDTLPSVLRFDFEWQQEHHHFEVAVFSYANVFGLFRLAFTALYWGATFFLLLYLTMIVYRLVRWLVSMFGGGSSAG